MLVHLPVLSPTLQIGYGKKWIVVPMINIFSSWRRKKKKKNPTIRFVCFYNLGWLHLLYFLLLGWMHFFFLNLLLKLYIELKKQNSAGFCCDLKTPKWINALYSGFPPLYTQTFASKHDLWEFPVFSMRQHSIDRSGGRSG